MYIDSTDTDDFAAVFVNFFIVKSYCQSLPPLSPSPILEQPATLCFYMFVCFFFVFLVVDPDPIFIILVGAFYCCSMGGGLPGFVVFLFVMSARFCLDCALRDDVAPLAGPASPVLARLTW